jgi:hypothetical protein
MSGGLGIHARAQKSNLLLVHRYQLGQLERTLSAIAASASTTKDPSVKRPAFLPGNTPNILSRLKSLAWGE